MLNTLTKDHKMYQLYMLNFGYYLDFETESLEEAMAKAVDTGFEVALVKDNTITKRYSPIGGWK